MDKIINYFILHTKYNSIDHVHNTVLLDYMLLKKLIISEESTKYCIAIDGVLPPLYLIFFIK